MPAQQLPIGWVMSGLKFPQNIPFRGWSHASCLTFPPSLEVSRSRHDHPQQATLRAVWVHLFTQSSVYKQF
jgi:hypothetical protein